MAIKNNSLRENFYKAEIISFLSSKLSESDFNAFVNTFNNYIDEKETQVTTLNTNLNNLTELINKNSLDIGTLKNIKADIDKVLIKNENGSYQIETSLACNKYTFLEDTTSCIRRIAGEDGLAVVINNYEVIYIKPDGIYLPYLSTEEGKLLVVGQQGKISTLDIKFKISTNGNLMYYNGSTWVSLE